MRLDARGHPDALDEPAPVEPRATSHTIRTSPRPLRAQCTAASCVCVCVCVCCRWNHAPLQLRASTFDAIRARHASALAAQHGAVTDLVSGKKLDVFRHLVPLSLASVAFACPAAASKAAPASKPFDDDEGGSPFGSAAESARDVASLWTWLKAAYAFRCELPSSLSKLSGMISLGAPDEAAGRLSDAMLATANNLPEARRRGAFALTDGSAKLAATKAAYLEEREQLRASQRSELEGFNGHEKATEDDFRLGQQREQQQLHEGKQRQPLTQCPQRPSAFCVHNVHYRSGRRCTCVRALQASSGSGRRCTRSRRRRRGG